MMYGYSGWTSMLFVMSILCFHTIYLAERMQTNFVELVIKTLACCLALT